MFECVWLMSWARQHVLHRRLSDRVSYADITYGSAKKRYAVVAERLSSHEMLLASTLQSSKYV